MSNHEETPGPLFDPQFERHSLPYEGPQHQQPLTQWTTVIIVILTWLMSAALTYGIVSTKVNYLEDRGKILETNQQHVLQTYMSREEFARYHEILIKDMEQRDDKLEQKIEQIRTLILETHKKAY